MSSDETQRLTRLTVRARLGVTFRVLDSSLREITRGADTLERAVPPGRYATRPASLRPADIRTRKGGSDLPVQAGAIAFINDCSGAHQIIAKVMAFSAMAVHRMWHSVIS